MHQRLEEWMAKFGYFLHDNPLKVILFLVVILAFPISNLPKITMDTSTEGFMHDDDPVLLNYNAFRDQFGRDERIVVAIQHEDIFSLPFLQTLKNLHEEIENTVPHLEEVTSLYKVRNTRGEGDKLYTDDLLEPFPTTQTEVDAIRERAMNSTFYRNLLINEAGDMTTLMIETDAYSRTGEADGNDLDALTEGFDDAPETSTPKTFLKDEENAKIVASLLEIVAKYRDQGLELYVAGSPSINHALKQQMRTDMQKFMRITFILILIFLFVIFRRASAVFYPLLVIILSLLTTVGTMAWMGVAFKLPTQIVPSLLLAVSIGATVHILSVFFDRFNATGDKREALSYTLGHSGLAIAMTSVTTAIGIASFSGSEVAPISDLGKFASLGVMVSLVLTLTLLPALLSLTKLKPKPSRTSQRLDGVMKKIAYLPIHHTKGVLIGSLILVIISLLAATQIRLSHNPLKWFQPDNPNRLSTEMIDSKMNGSVSIEVVIDTQEPNGWVNPERLNRLNAYTQELEQYVDDYTHVGKVISLATIVKETNQALHSNNSDHYTIPQEQNLVSQELLLFENSGSDDLEDVVDSQFSQARITVKLPWNDSVEAQTVLNHIRTTTAEQFSEMQTHVTGMVPILSHTLSNAVHSSVESYFIAFFAIAIMMMLILNSPRIGLLSMIPNLAPIIVGLLLMYIAKIPLDMFTLLIGSIAIGLAVDDTIHFTHNFRRYYLHSKDSSKAIEQTFLTTGKAMVITTIVLSLGFIAYLAAYMISVQNFGLLTASVIVFALLSDLLLAPALMVIAAKRGWIK
ncbi:MAG TPA: RND transporter [Campylobacterales bacterium]|nr:RND transporter [Campylobacterales bacterium]